MASAVTVRGRLHADYHGCNGKSVFPVDFLSGRLMAVALLSRLDAGGMNVDERLVSVLVDEGKIRGRLNAITSNRWVSAVSEAVVKPLGLWHTRFENEESASLPRLFMSAEDANRFFRMLACKGNLQGKKVLSPKAFGVFCKAFGDEQIVCRDGAGAYCRADLKTGDVGVLFSMTQGEESRRGLLAWCSAVKRLSDYEKPFECDALKPFDLTYERPRRLAPKWRRFQGCPSITLSPGGRLWVAWLSGAETEDDELAVIVATSGDGGDTWGNPVLFVDKAGPLRAIDPGLWTDPKGRVWLFWGQSYSFWDGRAGLWASSAVNPEQADTPWTDPSRIADGYMKNKPTVLSDGRCLFPIEFMPMDHAQSGDMYHTEDSDGPWTCPSDSARIQSVYVAAERCRSVNLIGTVPTRREERAYPEHMIVERRDGSLWLVGRMKYGIGESVSRDGGRTWMPMRPTGFCAPSSRFFLRRLRSGAILFVKNDERLQGKDGKGELGKRNVLKAWVSDDDGLTWEGGLVIDGRRNVTYPDAIEGSDGMIHLVSDFGRGVEREIVYHRFTEKDVRAGKLVDSRSRLRILVNNATEN